jgi:hypothetical protein
MKFKDVRDVEISIKTIPTTIDLNSTKEINDAKAKIEGK